MKLPMKQKQNPGHRKLIGDCLGGGREWEVGVSRWKLLYIENGQTTQSYYRAQRTVYNIL